jgi:hypothetical protein
MSYCGTCGSFYSPECPHRRDGGCQPAVNPFEQKIVEARAAIVAAEASIMAAHLVSYGQIMPANELLAIASELTHIFDEGSKS